MTLGSDPAITRGRRAPFTMIQIAASSVLVCGIQEAVPTAGGWGFWGQRRSRPLPRIVSLSRRMSIAPKDRVGLTGDSHPGKPAWIKTNLNAQRWLMGRRTCASMVAAGPQPALGEVISASSQDSDRGHDVSILMATIGPVGR
jgi:hypothetical protein